MADFRTIAQRTLNEVTESLARTDPRQFPDFLEALTKRRSVLLTGEGYCAGVVRVFAHGLSRLGIDARVVGESTTPGVKLGDLLVVVTEGGDSGVMAQRVTGARGQGASVAVVTGEARSRLLTEAQMIILLPGPTRTPFSSQTTTDGQSLVFAEAAMLYLDAVVKALAEQISRRDIRDVGLSLD